MRTHKKAGKAQERLNKGKQLAEELATDPDATLEDLEKCPNIQALEDDAQSLQERVAQLTELENQLAGIKKKCSVLPTETAHDFHGFQCFEMKNQLPRSSSWILF